MSSHDYEDIAIVGVGCRYPGNVQGLDDFWTLLSEKIDPIKKIPKERWNNDIFFDELKAKPGKTYVDQGGFVDGIDWFDAGLFKIVPREAAHVDPQQRLLLETTFDAFRDARVGIKNLKGKKVSVFAGVYIHDYQHLELANIGGIDAYSGTGTAMSIAANRISYYYDIHGPSMSVDTACSSALVALDLACQSLLSNDCEMAVAAGVNAILKPEMTIAMSKANMLSPDGRSKSFDASANGFARSEGAGVLVLKRLKDVGASERVLGLIKASGVNSDGATQGISVPNGVAQKSLFREVLAKSNLRPADIGYVEAHGTGTPVGDPIELNAIGEVFAKNGDRENVLQVGSVKSNIGHTESASGIAGVIKTLIALNHKKIPPNLHFNNPNPNIDFSKYAININSDPRDWISDQPRIALVNSFGFGGTNASVVIQEPPQRTDEAIQDFHPCVLPVSAHETRSLNQYLADVAEALPENASDAYVRDVCWNLVPFANDFQKRKAIVVNDCRNVARALSAAQGAPGEAKAVNLDTTAFVFSGMGSQWPGMFHGLMENPLLHGTIQEICELFSKKFNFNLFDELMKEEGQSNVDRTDIAQPAIFTIQVAIFKWLQSIGVEPSCILGHSVGEIAAAHCAGILPLEVGIEIIYHRSKLQQTTAGQGKLLAVGLSKENFSSYLEKYDTLDIAAINSPGSIAVAGPVELLDAIQIELSESGVFAKYVRTDVPFHSRYMNSIKEDFYSSVSGLKPQSPDIRFISTIEGREIGFESYDEGYWWKNIRESVRFSEGVFSAVEHGVRSFVEIGGHPVLSTSINECLSGLEVEGSVLPTLRRNRNNYTSLLEAAASLYESGVDVEFTAITPKGRFIDIPRYRYCKERYWIEDSGQFNATNYHAQGNVDSLLGSELVAGANIWNHNIDLGIDRYIEDHKVRNSVVYPGAGYINLMFHLCRLKKGNTRIALKNLKFSKMLDINTEESATLQVLLDDDKYIKMERLNEGGRELIARGEIPKYEPTDRSIEFDQVVRKDLNKKFSGDFLYMMFENVGLFYGERFRGIKELTVGGFSSLAVISMPESIRQEKNYVFHPATLDCVLHALFGSLRIDGPESHRLGEVYLPVSIDEVEFFNSPNTDMLYSYSEVYDRSLNSFTGNIYVFDEHKKPVAKFSGVCCRSLIKKKPGHLTDHQKGMVYEYSWAEISLAKIDKTPQSTMVITRSIAKSDMLLRKIESAGNKVVVVRPMIEKGVYHADLYVDEADPNAYQQVVDYARKHQVMHIINSWPLYQFDEGMDASIALDEEQNFGYGCVLGLAKGLSSEDSSISMTILTNGVYRLDSDNAINLPHSPVVGLVRVIRNEQPSLSIRHVDLDVQMDGVDSDGMMEAIFANEAEDEVALRGGVCYGHRFKHGVEHPDQVRSVSCGNYALALEEEGVLGSLRTANVSKAPLAEHDVEIEVCAAGVNFKDLMKMLGLLPEQAMEGNYWGSFIGMECSGVVSRVGKSVDSVKVGDAVVALSKNSFQKYVTVEDSLVFGKPSVVDFDRGASLPLTYLTAYYSLKYVANARRGESVLVHSAAGGVGQAAIAIGKHLGLKIFATAGSPEKRRYLEQQGIEHVYSSRDLSFYDGILRDTQGRGVDCVINSLVGDTLLKSFDLVKENGRFIELGKIDIVNNEGLPMHTFDRGVSFTAVDIDKLLVTSRAVAREAFQEVLSLIECGKIETSPVKGFEVDHAVDAFDSMKRAEHIGKLVLRFPDQGELEKPGLSTSVIIDPDASYLITGGLGGFGLQVADWLADRGAKHVVLQGRSGVKNSYQRQMLQAIESKGVQLSIIRGDIGDADHVKSLIEETSSIAPLKGIFHAAAVLRDALISEQNMEMYHEVARSKMKGAWLLHKYSAKLKIDYFVNFSSIVAAVGNRGSCNYCAANTFVDALSTYRNQLGLSAISVNWGLIANVGMATTEETIRIKLEEAGLTAMHTDVGLKILDRFINGARTEQLAIADVKWDRWRSHNGSSNSLRYERLFNVESDEEGESSSLDSLSGKPLEEIKRYFYEKAIELVSPILKIEADNISLSSPLSDLGIDSLMALEIRVGLEKIGIKTTIAKLFKGETLENMISKEASKLAGVGSGKQESEGGATVEAKPLEHLREGTPSEKRESYLRYYHPSPDTKVRMFCFPYAGASSSVFYDWSKDAGPDIEVVSISLPGRGERISENASASVRDTARLIAEEMLSHLDKPYILLGHCLGAIVMYEVVRQLQERKAPAPEVVFACAAAAPSLYFSPVVHKQNDNKFLDILKLLDFTNTRALIEDEEFRDVIFPTLRTDFEAVLGYNESPGDAIKIEAPIVAVAAQKDLFAAPEAVGLWRHYTSSEFTLSTLDTHHYFIESHREYLMSLAKAWFNGDLYQVLRRESGGRAPYSAYEALGEGVGSMFSSLTGRRTGKVLFLFTEEVGVDFAESNEINFESYEDVINFSMPRFFGDIDTYISGITSAFRDFVADLGDVQIDIWGHGFGAIISYECLLSMDSTLNVSQLVVSGSASPNNYVMPQVHLVDDRKLGFLLNVIDHPSSSDGVLVRDEVEIKGIKNYFEASCAYIHRKKEGVISVPIVAVRFEDDLWTYFHGVDGWRKYTSQSYQCIESQGSHFKVTRDGREKIETVFSRPDIDSDLEDKGAENEVFL